MALNGVGADKKNAQVLSTLEPYFTQKFAKMAISFPTLTLGNSRLMALHKL